MDAASLLQLAKARGIDFQEVAGTASNLDGIAQKRHLTRAEIKHRNEIKISLNIQETVRGRQSRTYRHPAWSIAELGQAARGLGLIPWTAALYSFAGAQDGYWLLWSALASEANHIARREHWPARVVTEGGDLRFYRESLAMLVLDEDAHKHLFMAAPRLYSVYMDVTEIVWDQSLTTPFRSLKTAYERWLATARSSIGRWIREPTHSEIVDKNDAHM
jgi:hypothetical protein